MPDPLKDTPDMPAGRLTLCADAVMKALTVDNINATKLTAALPQYSPNEILQALDFIHRVGLDHQSATKKLKGGTE